MKLYVVGRFIEETKDGAIWDYCGIFFRRKTAEKYCVSENHFVGPVPFNKYVGDFPNVLRWPSCYYPKIEGTRT